MEITLTLTDAQVIALETIANPKSGKSVDTETLVKSVINNLADTQLDKIVSIYVLDKLGQNKKVGFANKNDIVISAKNEGFLDLHADLFGKSIPINLIKLD